MKELFEERAKKIAEMKSLDENAKDRAMTEEERTSFEKLESEIRELDTKIDAEKRKNTLNGFSEKVPLARDENQKNEANERASAFVASGKTQMRALLSSGTIAKPTNVGTDIAGLGEVANSIVDDVRAVALSGAGAWVEPYKDTEASAEAVTDGSEIGGTGATFKYVEISPKEWGVLDEISNQVKKLSPVDYLSAIEKSALIALREKAAALIITAIHASALAEKKTYALDATFVRSLVLGYRSIAGKGNVKLYIAQEDLATLGAVRGTNEKKPVYEIEFDAGTTTSGTIKDGGTAVQFRVLDGLTKGTQFFGQPQNVVMPMWDNYQIETDQGGDYFKRNVMGIRGLQTANVDLCAKNGMQIVSQSE